MKRVLAIFKDLQDSGQQAAIIGQFSIQHGQVQDVTESNDACVLPNNGNSLTDENQNSNRYITEHGRDDVGVWYSASSVSLPPELVEVVAVWSNLPDAVKAGILAMVRTIPM